MHFRAEDVQVPVRIDVCQGQRVARQHIAVQQRAARPGFRVRRFALALDEPEWPIAVTGAQYNLSDLARLEVPGAECPG